MNEIRRLGIKINSAGFRILLFIYYEHATTSLNTYVTSIIFLIRTMYGAIAWVHGAFTVFLSNFFCCYFIRPINFIKIASRTLFFIMLRN